MTQLPSARDFAQGSARAMAIANANELCTTIDENNGVSLRIIANALTAIAMQCTEKDPQQAEIQALQVEACRVQMELQRTAVENMGQLMQQAGNMYTRADLAKAWAEGASRDCPADEGQVEWFLTGTGKIHNPYIQEAS